MQSDNFSSRRRRTSEEPPGTIPLTTEELSGTDCVSSTLTARSDWANSIRIIATLKQEPRTDEPGSSHGEAAENQKVLSLVRRCVAPIVSSSGVHRILNLWHFSDTERFVGIKRKYQHASDISG